jgi:hypothetical protein
VLIERRRLRRSDHTSVRALERAYATYDRALQRTAARVGARQPAVINTRLEHRSVADGSEKHDRPLLGSVWEGCGSLTRETPRPFNRGASMGVGNKQAPIRGAAHERFQQTVACHIHVATLSVRPRHTVNIVLPTRAVGCLGQMGVNLAGDTV